MQQLLHVSIMANPERAYYRYQESGSAVHISIVSSCTCSSMCIQGASHIEKSCLSSVRAADDQVWRNAHDRIYWQRKVDAGAAAGAQPCEGGHVDADQPCAAVQERPSAVALADRSIHLHATMVPLLSHCNTCMMPMCSIQHVEAVKQQEHVRNLYGAADRCAHWRGDCTVDPTAHQLPMRQVGLSSPSSDRSRSTD